MYKISAKKLEDLLQSLVNVEDHFVIHGPGSNFKSCKLKGARIFYKDYREVTFGEAKLDYARFKGMILTGADFSVSYLRGAKFSYSDLRKADFSGTDLTKTRFENCNLRGIDLTQARVDFRAFSSCLVDQDIAELLLNNAVLVLKKNGVEQGKVRDYVLESMLNLLPGLPDESFKKGSLLMTLDKNTDYKKLFFKKNSNVISGVIKSEVKASITDILMRAIRERSKLCKLEKEEEEVDIQNNFSLEKY